MVMPFLAIPFLSAGPRGALAGERKSRPESARNRSAGPMWTMIALAWLALLPGCDDADGPVDPAAAALAREGGVEGAVVTAVDPAPGAVELLSATGVPRQLDEELSIVEFDVAYRFTAGTPAKYYLCEISFPGTERWGVKPFMPHDLQPEGSFTTKIEVGNDPVDAFEMTLSEANSPDQGYNLISNKLTGQVESQEE